MKPKIISALLILVTIQSCVKDDVGKSHVETFDFIWSEMDENYGGFSPRMIDWDEVYESYYPQAVLSTTEDELWEVCINMLDLLDDQHIFMYSSKSQKGFSSGKVGDELLTEKEFESSIIKDNYIEEFTTVLADGEEFIYGKIIAKNLGYIYIPNFELDGSNWHEKIDDAIRILQNTDGLIVDVRNNGGGSPLLDRFMASRFIAEEKFVFTIQTRNGPVRDDFDEPIKYFSKPKGDMQYTKQIIALTNHSTVSAGEEFLLFLETQNHVTIVGDATSNAFSSTAFNRLLPNGWEFGFPNQLYSYPDGSSPEGIGIIPDIYIRNDSTDVQNGDDAFDVTIRQGTEHLVLVSSDDNIIGRVNTSITNGLLRVTLNNGNYQRVTLRVEITTPDLDRIQLSDAVGGQLIDFVSINELSVVLNDASRLDMSGSSPNLILNVNDASEINGFNFTTGICTIAIGDASEVDLTVTDRLEGRLSDASIFRFRGDPEQDVEVSDASRIINAN